MRLACSEWKLIFPIKLDFLQLSYYCIKRKKCCRGAGDGIMNLFSRKDDDAAENKFPRLMNTVVDEVHGK